jgi:hypothetical protein
MKNTEYDILCHMSRWRKAWAPVDVALALYPGTKRPLVKARTMDRHLVSMARRGWVEKHGRSKTTYTITSMGFNAVYAEYISREVKAGRREAAVFMKIAR